MTPKEKAKELVMRNFEITVDDYCAKQCALIAVEEILMALDEHQWQNRNVIEFYLCVKQDIINL